jgi:hypothetical protein
MYINHLICNLFFKSPNLIHSSIFRKWFPFPYNTTECLFYFTPLILILLSFHMKCSSSPFYMSKSSWFALHFKQLIFSFFTVSVGNLTFLSITATRQRWMNVRQLERIRKESVVSSPRNYLGTFYDVLRKKHKNRQSIYVMMRPKSKNRHFPYYLLSYGTVTQDMYDDTAIGVSSVYNVTGILWCAIRLRYM